jgi:hypothetical protein
VSARFWERLLAVFKIKNPAQVGGAFDYEVQVFSMAARDQISDRGWEP